MKRQVADALRDAAFATRKDGPEDSAPIRVFDDATPVGRQTPVSVGAEIHDGGHDAPEGQRYQDDNEEYHGKNATNDANLPTVAD